MRAQKHPDTGRPDGPEEEKGGDPEHRGPERVAFPIVSVDASANGGHHDEGRAAEVPGADDSPGGIRHVEGTLRAATGGVQREWERPSAGPPGSAANEPAPSSLTAARYAP